MKYKFIKLLLLVFSLTLLASLFSSGVLANWQDYKGPIPKKFNQAPQLEQLVKEGKLPPVEERLPKEPLVMKPYSQIGKYGGTWNRFSTAESWDFFRMAMYGHSFVRWIEDGRNIAPNIVKKWETKENKSIWIFHFREGIKWSDGTPFTVDDFMFWWEDMAKNSECSEVVPYWAKQNKEEMKVTKIDDFTLKLDYGVPAPNLLGKIATQVTTGQFGHQIVPSHYLKEFHPDYNKEYDNFDDFDEKREWWHNTECPVLTAWMPVEHVSGSHLVYKRNPYYYAVDTEGNQLPYIDNVRIEYLSDPEVFKLKLSKGESDMQIRPNIFDIREMSILKKNEEKHNFKTLRWDSGSGTGPIFYPNHNHPDPVKRKLYRNPKFLKALSHAINREKLNKMIFYDTGTPTTGTYSPKAIEYHRTEKGKNLYKKWKNLAIEYKPEMSKSLLDEVKVIDTDGDGWREMPNGEPLTLRIDLDSEANQRHVDISEFTKEFWRDIGIKTIVNPIDGSELSVMQTNANFDIRDSWEVGNGPNHLTYPQWLVPMGNGRWAPLYGKWFQIQGTASEGTQLDKAPRDKNPPRKEPESGSPVAKLQDLIKKASTAPTWQERDELVHEMIEIHINNGPFYIGTVGNYARIGVINNNLKNCPVKKEELPHGGFINPWSMYIATLNPPQFYFEE